MTDSTKDTSAKKDAPRLRYAIQRGTWDTFIVPRDWGEELYNTWEQAKEIALSYLDWILEEQQYSSDHINAVRVANGGTPSPFPAIPGNDQMEAEIRDFIEILRQDIAESPRWQDYARRRIWHDERDACNLFAEFLGHGMFD